MLSTAPTRRVTVTCSRNGGGGSARIGHNQKVTAARESLASGRLVLAFACTLLVTGITNTYASAIGLVGVAVAALATFCIIARG
jgi:hypothetical protein